MTSLSQISETFFGSLKPFTYWQQQLPKLMYILPPFLSQMLDKPKPDTNDAQVT